MKLVFLLLALLVGEICLAEETTVPPKAKNGTGPGRHNSGGHRRNYDNDDSHSHEHGRGYGHKKSHKRYRAPIVDDYVCDLEATILVVSSKHHVKEEKSYDKTTPAYGGSSSSAYGAPQQQYGGGQQSYGGSQQPYGGGQQSYGGGQQSYGGDTSPSYGGQQSYENKPKRREYATPEALRLKCSHIAIHSEHDCHTCCQLSARRYHSVSKNEIFGFIIDASEIKEDDKGYVKQDGKGYNRSKRNADYGAQPAQPASNYQSQSYGSVPPPSYTTAAPSYPAPGYSNPAPSYSNPAPSYPDAGYGNSEPNYEVPSYPAPEPQEPSQGYSADSGYAAAASNSYAPTSYGSYGPPKDARCVCCSPKRHDYHHKHHNKDRSYDRSDSDSNEY